MVKLATLLLVVWVFSYTANASEPGRNEILEIFKTYEALNADFISFVNNSKGECDKTYEALRNKTEEYAEGPFETALVAARHHVCKEEDLEVVNALFRVTIATSNSASELPMTTLGYMFVCQPSLVKYSFLQLSKSDQKTYYHDLEFGFENAVYDKPKNDKRTIELRNMLRTLKPME